MFITTPQGRVEIKDLTQDVFSEILKFMYTGNSPNVDRMANALLSAADKVILTGLSFVFM